MDKKKLVHASAILGLVVLFTLGAYVICTKLAETFFFDKFYYQKSEKYGYVHDASELIASTRNADMYRFGLLKDQKPSFPDDTRVKGIEDDGSYRVALIGDSFVWGQGVKESDRFSTVLQKQLSTSRKTEVYALGLPAESLLDTVGKVEALSKTENINLFVVPAVQNDALLLGNGTTFNRYGSPVVQKILDDCLAQFPDQPPLAYPDWSKASPLEMIPISEKLDKDTENSWSTEPNKCIVDAAMRQIQTLSKGKVLFIITDDYTPEQSMFGPYKILLNRYSVPFVSSIQMKDSSEFRQYWKNPAKYFVVSAREAHPSAVAYQMYAALVANELQRNPKWGFLQAK